MDDERLKNPDNIFGHDYFEEQLARIRDIRSSERRFYQKVTTEIARTFAENEFEKYRVILDRTFESDFDKDLQKISD
jgi:hypothetical protein